MELTAVELNDHDTSEGYASQAGVLDCSAAHLRQTSILAADAVELIVVIQVMPAGCEKVMQAGTLDSPVTHLRLTSILRQQLP